MIPKWKITRELQRLREQTDAWLSNLYEPFLKLRHDRWRDRQPVPQDQGAAFTGKVAIFLIYQPHGVAPSVLLTLRWLVKNGYAPLVIANAPLSTSDRAAFKTLTWRIFERPNFGYDFGGYRDAVILLGTWGIVPSQLLILNDSVWMPLREDSTLIARLEGLNADVAGGILHSDSLRSSGKIRRGHLESYLYLLSRKAIESPALQRFWKRYPVSSKRLNAVHRGERRFAYLMKDAGLRVVGLFSRQGFLDAMATQDDAALRRTLLYASYVEDYLKAEANRLLHRPVDATWREAVLAHIQRTAERRRFNACFAYPSDLILGMDFMKKSPGSTGDGGASLHSRLRRQLLRAVAAGDLPSLAPEVLAEISAKERHSTSDIP